MFPVLPRSYSATLILGFGSRGAFRASAPPMRCPGFGVSREIDVRSRLLEDLRPVDVLLGNLPAACNISCSRLSDAPCTVGQGMLSRVASNMDTFAMHLLEEGMANKSHHGQETPKYVLDQASHPLVASSTRKDARYVPHDARFLTTNEGLKAPRDLGTATKSWIPCNIKTA
jgi:hypothetical protein